MNECNYVFPRGNNKGERCGSRCEKDTHRCAPHAPEYMERQRELERRRVNNTKKQQRLREQIGNLFMNCRTLTDNIRTLLDDDVAPEFLKLSLTNAIISVRTFERKLADYVVMII